MKSQAANDWRLILLAVGSGAAGLLVLSSAMLGGVVALFGSWFNRQGVAAAELPSGSIILGALLVVGCLLLISMYVALRHLRGHPNSRSPLGPARVSEVTLIVLAWLTCSMLAQLVQGRDLLRGLAPVFQILAISLPLWLLLRLGLAGLACGSVLRLWGTLASGLLLATGIAAAIEITLLITASSAMVMYLAFNPERLLAVEELAMQLSQATAVEDVLRHLEPILTHPAALVGMLVAVSVVTPLVEELAKSAAPWLIFERLDSPAAGFWCGAISGAGFALFEGLIASAEPTDQWALIFLARGWSSLMHVLASAMAGWGIAAFRRGLRISRLFIGYGFAMAIHAAWNASVVLLGFGGARSFLKGGEVDVPGIMALAAGGLVLLALVVLMPLALVTLNRRPRAGQVNILGRNTVTGGGPVTTGSMWG